MRREPWCTPTWCCAHRWSSAEAAEQEQDDSSTTPTCWCTARCTRRAGITSAHATPSAWRRARDGDPRRARLRRSLRGSLSRACRAREGSSTEAIAASISTMAATCPVQLFVQPPGARQRAPAPGSASPTASRPPAAKRARQVEPHRLRAKPKISTAEDDRHTPGAGALKRSRAPPRRRARSSRAW